MSTLWHLLTVFWEHRGLFAAVFFLGWAYVAFWEWIGPRYPKTAWFLLGIQQGLLRGLFRR